MADWYGKKRLDEDLQEEDVWGVVKEREDVSPEVKKAQKAHKRYSSSSSTSSSAWSLNAAPRMNIPRAHKTKVVQHQQQSSAPVNIPDWSKIYNGKKPNMSWVEDDHEDGENNMISNEDIGSYQECVDGDCDDDDDDEDEEMVPPHEYIARRMARTQISSYSMCEGVGRTLKGRDLSKVRNAILAKTGFLE